VSFRSHRILCLALLFGCLATAPAWSIEAVKGKNYTLTKEHGPWMVMVASFRNVPKDRREEGLSAEDAALELVYELRKAGIPAYTHAQGAVVEKIETVDRQGRDDERIFAAQRDMVCVLAGNWNAIDEKEAQKVLADVKKYQPKFMKAKGSGAIFRVSAGQKGPLGGAFMTINPLLTPEEIAHKKADPVVVQLNHHSRYPLIKAKGKYTVQVATFTGKHAMQVNANEFDRRLADKNSYSLNRAGEDAEQLAAALRQERKVEAYVHHDRFQSIVTVGAFDTPDDPLGTQIRRQFWPQANPESQSNRLQPQTLVLPRGNNPGDVPLVWVFDLQPQVIPVPKVK
jgi:hypothetical protein